MSGPSIVDQLHGVFVPMFTPFTSDAAAVDVDQLRHNVRFLVEHGIRILNPAGSTGEFWTLTEDEHRLVLKTVIEEARAAADNVIICAGVSHPHLHETIAMSRFAIDCGADCLQVTPPFYLPASDDDIVMYYQRLGKAVGAPIMAYEHVQGTGVKLRGRVLERICEQCPEVVALKTASLADTPREFERITRQFAARLKLFSATGVYYATFSYLSGVDGITDTIANAVPTFGLTIDRLGREGRWDEMNALYQAAFDVLEIELIYGRAGLKQIGACCGVGTPATRYPLTTLDTAAVEDIKQRLAQWPPAEPFLQR